MSFHLMYLNAKRPLFRLSLLLFIGLLCSGSEWVGAQTPVNQWVFEPANVSGTTVSDQAGSLNGTIKGTVAWGTTPNSLSLAGGSYVEISPAMNTAQMPQKNITVEAWVKLRSYGSWPALVSCVQDNGSFERGWCLGVNSSKFYWALAGDTTLNYMYAPSTFALNQWYHVVGTYDGTTMRLYVNGAQVASATSESGNINYATAPFVLGNYKDDNDNYPMDGWMREAAMFNSTLTAAEVQARYDAQAPLFESFSPSLGPYVQFDGGVGGTVCWETATPQPSIVEYSSPGEAAQRVSDATLKTKHRVFIQNLKTKTEYSYSVIGLNNTTEQASGPYTFETDYHYQVAEVPSRRAHFPAGSHDALLTSVASSLLTQTGVTKGYALDLGGTDARLAYELVKSSDLNVIIVHPDPAVVLKLRKQLHAVGVYGSRVTVIQSDLNSLPFTGKWFNLIVSSDLLTGGAMTGNSSELLRVLRPHGIAVLGMPTGADGDLLGSDPDAWVRAGITAADADITTENGRMTSIKRKPLSGIGQWSHNFGDAGQSCASNDQRVGTDEMQIQWFGLPGPRSFTDRQARNPTPLVVNGTLFMQGDNRISAQDSYNGSVYWSAEIPGARRVNMPRDGGNWSADSDSLYFALRNNLLRFNAYTGERMRSYNIPLDPKKYDWGYVANVGDKVYGSCVKKNSFYTTVSGSWEFWYDSPSSTKEISKICSHQLFCLNKSDGTTAWTYDGGVVINSTIAIGNGRVYFIDCRNSNIAASTTGRIGSTDLWSQNYMVALDASTGALIWEKPITIPSSPQPGVIYLSWSDNALFLLSSTNQYNARGFSTADGTQLWSNSYAWARNNHGAHIYHPVIMGNYAIAEPRAFNIHTGEVQKNLPTRAGCSTMSGAGHVATYVNSSYNNEINFWDIQSDHKTLLRGMRSSCWLSMMSGDGMIFLAAASSGCACSFPIQTTVSFSAP